jgi:integrase
LKRLAALSASNRPINTSKRTVGQFMLQWLEDHVKATNAPLTYRGYEQTTRMYIIPRLGKIPLERLSGQDVQRCLNQASKDGLSPSSVKNINATLKTALSTGKKWGCVERNAAKDATPPKQVKFAAKALTVEQSERLLKVMAGHRYEAIIVVALLMGLRRGEVAGLRWSEIDFNEGMLHVRTALQRIPGKGVQLQGVKSQKSHRHSPMPALCIAALLRRRQMQLAEKRAAGTKWKQDSDFVFTSRYGARIVIEELTRELDKALELAKLPHVRFHDLRHSTAGLLIAKGVTLKFVQEILGHANFQITADLYTHLLPSQLRDAAQTMNDIFEKPDVAPDVAPTTRQPIQ